MSPMDPSFETFVVESAVSLLGYARALTADPADASDLVQEALARMGERWDRHRVEDPAAYARTVMVRLNIDRLRRIRRELELVSRSRQRQQTLGADHEAGSDHAWLSAALAGLTPRQRTALALRYVDDLTTEAVATRMGCSPGTARSHLSRGLERLRGASPARSGQPQAAPEHKEVNQ